MMSIREAVSNPDSESTDGNDMIQEFLHNAMHPKDSALIIKQIINV